jgi:hypothetical protein
MLNRAMHLLFLVLLSSMCLFPLMACHPREIQTVTPIPYPEFEESASCELHGRTVELDVEVTPGLRLLRITGIPPYTTDKLQWDVALHFMRTSTLVNVPNFQVYVTAETTFGAEPVGYMRLSEASSTLAFYRTNRCIPVPCSIAIPLSASPMLWELKARLWTSPSETRDLALGSVRTR